MIRKLFVLLAWVSLGYIVYVTLSPIGLRPIATHNPAHGRLVAYAVVGVLFGLAYPGRVCMALGIVVGAAIALEGLQYFSPNSCAAHTHPLRLPNVFRRFAVAAQPLVASWFPWSWQGLLDCASASHSAASFSHAS